MPLHGTVRKRGSISHKAKRAVRKARQLFKTGQSPTLGSVRRRRAREYLTPKEVERLIIAAKKRGRRYGLRDATMIWSRTGTGCASPSSARSLGTRLISPKA